MEVSKDRGRISGSEGNFTEKRTREKAMDEGEIIVSRVVVSSTTASLVVGRASSLFPSVYSFP